MASGDRDFELPLPAQWPPRARAAIVHSLTLAHVGLPAAADRLGETARLQHEFALLHEELRVKHARMERCRPIAVPSPSPRFPSVDRLAVLENRVARGWSLSQTTERFHVTTTPPPPA